ncbi:NERD nuclease [Salipaludibacillus neizhouensis]|uniref:NERD nuclease n=1 Tax=Salipaludibacillus neizhouensis TaxID=885475 RepID=A0A3A9K059_9BACI|nr:nuclease-related domain-containing protein [Salipaludibacillus neizhouensis]RKL66484.1 NERD nuclease [Salipaludibacillus neizhouensis]
MSFLNFFKKKKDEPSKKSEKNTHPPKPNISTEMVAARKGEIGEYKIDIQLDQLPKDILYLSDLLIENKKAKSGYSQIDHVILSPYGIIVIETKNYKGTIYGGKERNTWLVNGKFKMMNPFVQNYGHIQALKTLVDLNHKEIFISMVSFTKRCTFKVGVDYRKITSDELLVYDIELSEFIHRKISTLKLQHKEPLLSSDDISIIYKRFSNANIADAKIRERHTQALKNQTINEVTNQPFTCAKCHKPVSAKVRSYCLSKQKFKGEIYCFDHQKAIK